MIMVPDGGVENRLTEALALIVTNNIIQYCDIEERRKAESFVATAFSLLW